VRLRLALALAAIWLASAAAPPAQAASPATDRRTYAAAVEQARALVEEARNGRPEAAGQALDSLHSVGADRDLPDVARDLAESPPDLADADRRLSAASAALARPGDVADPARAKSQLDGILAEDRYGYLHRSPPNPVLGFLNSALSTILGWLSRQRVGVPPLPAVPTWVWLALVAAVAALAAGFALTQLRGLRLGWPRRRPKTAGEPLPEAAVARHAEDRFSAADRLAAAGDHRAALRSLIAAVATELSGRPFWEQSPLTVRELFRERGRLEELRPLLLAFERAVYGKQPVSPEAYAECAGLAQPFREHRHQARAA
jgi:hypothetical protein